MLLGTREARSAWDKQHDGVGLDGQAEADRIDALVRLGLHIHTVEVDGEQVGEACPDRFAVGGELGAFEDDRGVEVADRQAFGVHAAECLGEEVARIASLVLRGRVGEELADVGLGECAEECVGDGVEEGVAVGMRDGGVVVGDGDTAEDEGLGVAGVGGLKAVEVPAVTDAD